MLSIGTDGVLVLGCHAGDCQYVEENYKALRRILLSKDVEEVWDRGRKSLARVVFRIRRVNIYKDSEQFY